MRLVQARHVLPFLFAGALVGCSKSESSQPLDQGVDASVDSALGDAGPVRDGGSAAAGDAGVTDGSSLEAAARPDAAPFTLTSSALAEGAAFPAEHTCTGGNTSPPLDWSGAPVDAKSFALVLTDLSNGLIHSVIYDIPKAVTGLPANVDKAYRPANVPGSRQTVAYDSAVTGYMGPCPPSLHTYEFALYALDVDTLPGGAMGLKRDPAQTTILEHDLAVAKLTGTYQKP
jgi:Raf kinase inhibitor-like YbhB/YbcL family protein